MTDENTRLPSDSVVEGDLAFISALAECAIAHGRTILTRETAVSLLGVVGNIEKALAAQPRDDVREASTYERLGQMLRREKLKPTARFLEAAYLGYNLCRMERDGRIALSQGDEQPDTQDVPTIGLRTKPLGCPTLPSTRTDRKAVLLAKCRDTFREYGDNHTAKASDPETGTATHRAKAERNYELAREIDEVLSTSD